MVDLLLQHARSAVWSDIMRDNQYVLACSRITQPGGVFRFFTHARRKFALPQSGTGFFNVYHVGAYQEGTFDLDLDQIDWISANQLADGQKAVVEFILDNGCTIPRNLVWLKLLSNRNIVVAVEQTVLDLGSRKVIDPVSGQYITIPNTIEASQLTLRVYSNYLYRTQQWVDNQVSPTPVVCRYLKIQNASNFNALDSEWNSLLSQYGNAMHGQWYVDGYMVSKPAGYTNSLIGKNVGFVWDESVISSRFVSLEDCPAFLSQLDMFSRKRAVVSQGFGDIIFHDDCDFFLADMDGLNYRAVRLPYHPKGTIEQLTHNSYAIRADVIESLQNAHGAGFDKLFIVSRNGGYNRTATNTSVRLQELYQLPYNEVVQAIAGVNSGVPEWTAAALENSAYTRLMASQYKDIDVLLLNDAYGYDLITSIFAKPNRVIDTQTVQAPLICQQPIIEGTGSTKRCVFGYTNGFLVGYQNDSSVLPTIPLSGAVATAQIAEVLQGHISSTDGVFYDQNVSSHELTAFGFRCYACSIVSGVPTGDWSDVTDSVYYQFNSSTNPPKITWNFPLLDAANLYPAVKIGNTIQVFELPGFDSAGYDGHMKFTVGYGPIPQIPPGQVSVYVNGVSQVNGIDFAMDWPTISINRKPAEQNVENLSILVRTMGWCDASTMQPWVIENGFVKDGVVSINGRFDTRFNGTGLVIVGGKFLPYDEVRFQERQAGLASTDGVPYSISSYILPLETVTQKSSYLLLQKEVAFKQKVSDYLTIKQPPAGPVNPVIIGDRWRLFSPVVSALIHSLNDGYLGAGQLDAQYTNVDVDQWMLPFIGLLPFDPAYIGFDANYIEVSAHQFNTTMSLTNAQYRFVEYVIKHYLFDRIDLTPTVLNLG